jgi:hypothetical protein
MTEHAMSAMMTGGGLFSPTKPAYAIAVVEVFPPARPFRSVLRRAWDWLMCRSAPVARFRYDWVAQSIGEPLRYFRDASAAIEIIDANTPIMNIRPFEQPTDILIYDGAHRVLFTFPVRRSVCPCHPITMLPPAKWLV